MRCAHVYGAKVVFWKVNTNTNSNTNTKKSLPYFCRLESHFDLWRGKNCVSASQREINIQIHSDSYRGKLKFKYKLKLKKQTCPTFVDWNLTLTFGGKKTASLRRSERLIFKYIPIAIGVNSNTNTNSNTKKSLPYFCRLESHFDLWREKNCVSASQREINIQIHSDSYRSKLKHKKKPTLLLAVGISLWPLAEKKLRHCVAARY